MFNKTNKQILKHCNHISRILPNILGNAFCHGKYCSNLWEVGTFAKKPVPHEPTFGLSHACLMWTDISLVAQKV